MYDRPAALLFDVSGTLMLGRDAIPGAPEAVAALKERGLIVRYFSNDPRTGLDGVVQRIRDGGFPVERDDVLSAPVVTATWLREHHRGARALVIGGEGIRALLEQYGLTVVDDLPADAVVVAGLATLDFRQLTLATQAVMDGAILVATGLDRRVRLAEHRWGPGTGAAVQAIAWATGAVPRVLGKPSPESAAAALRLLGVPGSAAIMVGDLVDEDVALGKRMGARTVLVLSGGTHHTAVPGLEADRKPDQVWARVGPELVDWVDWLRQA